MSLALRLAIITTVLVLQGCATQPAIDPALMSFDQGHLPVADVTLNIAGLGPCTDNPDRTLHLNSKEPVTVLVHGCFGSSGQFRGLAEVLAFHGQQSACFTYDDRAALDDPARELASAIDELVKSTNHPPGTTPVTIIGHSQGALVARRSLTSIRPTAVGRADTKIELVTISGPFAGIAAANACGSPFVQVISLGLIAPMCRIGTGAKWTDITYSSDFILNPGTLTAQVRKHWKIDTDERGSCRRMLAGRCAERDLTFTLEEQRNPIVDHDGAAEVIEVKAGHVEIVGDNRVAPTKLIAILQEHGVIRKTQPQRLSAFDALLARIYGVQVGADLSRPGMSELADPGLSGIDGSQTPGM
ncbi:MAG: alpha/beta hydrolase [Casimicrobiaceae bacterium]